MKRYTFGLEESPAETKQEARAGPQKLKYTFGLEPEPPTVDMVDEGGAFVAKSAPSAPSIDFDNITEPQLRELGVAPAHNITPVLPQEVLPGGMPSPLPPEYESKSFSEWYETTPLRREAKKLQLDLNTPEGLAEYQRRLGPLAAQPGETPSPANFKRVFDRAMVEAALPVPTYADRPTTGNKILDILGNFLGTGAGFIMPTGAGSAAIKEATALSAAPRVMAGTESIAGRLTPLAEKAAAKIPTSLVPAIQKAPEEIAERGVRGAIAGGIYGGTRGLGTGEDVSDIPKAALEDAALFAGLDIALPIAGRAIKAGAKKGFEAFKREIPVPKVEGLDLTREKPPLIPLPVKQIPREVRSGGMVETEVPTARRYAFGIEEPPAGAVAPAPKPMPGPSSPAPTLPPAAKITGGNNYTVRIESDIFDLKAGEVFSGKVGNVYRIFGDKRGVGFRLPNGFDLPEGVEVAELILANGERKFVPTNKFTRWTEAVKEVPQVKPGTPTSRISTVKTERGTEVKTEYTIVDAGNLVASHDVSLRPNERYPAELQPRQRERVASEDQINRIATNLEPSFLGESPKASEGAPIVGPDMVVESGNGRIIALQRVYGSNHPNAQKYREWLTENAERFGVSKEALQGVNNPVLVRVRRSEVDRVRFAQEANEPSTASMSATEQASMDANKLTTELLNSFMPSETGEILTASNRAFIAGFIERVIGPSERGRYITADGSISQEGVTRIRNAIFAKAYDGKASTAAIERLAESTDNNVRNITSGMLQAAPRIARMREGIASGDLHPLDIATDITHAMQKLSHLRETGQTVESYLGQQGLFGQELSDISKDLLDVFNKNKRSAKKIAAVINTYVDAVENLGNPKQGRLFGAVIPTKAELLEAAIRKVEGQYGQQVTLFPGEGAGSSKDIATFESERIGGPPIPTGRPLGAESSLIPRPREIGASSPVNPPATGREQITPVTVEPRTLEEVKFDYVRQLPPGIEIPNARYVIELFNATREIGSPARYKIIRSNVLGTFHPGGGKITLQTIEGIATLSHEFGHGLDYSMNGRSFPRSIKARFPDTKAGEMVLRRELKEVSNLMRPVPGGPAKFNAYRNSHTELMADFHSLYLLDPAKARELAPNITAAFEAKLQKMPKFKQLIDGLMRERERKVDAGPDVSAIRPVKKSQRLIPPDVTEPTEAVKSLVVNADRIYRENVKEAAIKAERWAKELPEEQLEDIGAMVEKIGNLRTGKTFDEIKASFTPEQHRILKEYRYYQELAREGVNKFLRTAGEKEYIKYIEDYLAHFYVKESKKFKDFIARWAKSSPNAKKRHLPTLQEAVEAGLTPITQNVAELHARWAAINWRVAVNKRFVFELTRVVNDEGKPVIMKPNEAPATWIYVDHPAIQQHYARKNEKGEILLWRGGAMVDPNIYPYVRQVFDQPFTGNAVKAIETFNAYAKKLQLSISLFHHWALTESAQAALARGRNPLRGFVLAGREGETVGTGLRLPFTDVRVTQPHRAGLRLLQSEEFRRDATRHGLVLGDSADVQVARVQQGLKNLEVKTQKVPGLGFITRKLRQVNQSWDRALWDRYHNGLKAYTYYDLVKEALHKAPDKITEAQIRQTKEKIADLVNDMFGGMEWAGKFWLTPKGRQVAHMALLAPDWTLSNLNVVGKMLTKRNDPVYRGTLLRYWRNMLLTFAAYTAGISYAISGKWPWENEPDHEWDINVTRIMKQMPWLDKDDQRQYYIAPGKQFREILSWIQNPVKILGHKASPAVHTVVEQMAGVQLGGDAWEMPWTREDMNFYEGMPERLQAVAEKFVPFSFGNNQFAFAFPLSRGMSAWKAERAFEELIKANVDPKPYQKIFPRSLARDRAKDLIDACRLNGLDPGSMIKQANTRVRGEYYNQMWKALDREDYEEADRAAKILLKLGATPKTVQASGKNRDLEKGLINEATQMMRAKGGK